MPPRSASHSNNPLILKLRTSRQLHQLTTETLSKRIGISQGQLTNWELGKQCPSFTNFIAWANALGYHLTLQKLP